MFRTIKAKFPATCRRCGNVILVGGTMRYGGASRTYHLKADCGGAQASEALHFGRCEDFPCCGHEAGSCPAIDSQGRERYRCCDCGSVLALHASSSLCGGCQRRLQHAIENGIGEWA